MPIGLRQTWPPPRPARQRVLVQVCYQEGMAEALFARLFFTSSSLHTHHAVCASTDMRPPAVTGLGSALL